MQAQAPITEELNQERIDTRTRVLVEEYDESYPAWLGRTSVEAPEVDGCVLLPEDAALTPGEFVDVEITDAQGYDVMAEIL
jgi:ribosomal protein S12 methylthiotransferase